MPNTTATTSSQIIVPGLETAISNVVTPIVATTNAAVTTLSTNINTNISSLGNKFARAVTSIDNTETSPYPTFAIWTNNNNQPNTGFHFINSDLQSIGTANMPGWLAGYQDPALNNMPNWYEDFRSYTYTNGNFDSSTVTTYFGGSTVWGSADGHQIYRPNLNNGFAGNWFNRADQTGQYLIRCGSIIGARGVRQRVSHYTTDSEFQIRFRGQTYGYQDRVDLNSATYATWAGRTNRGMSSYNDRTQVLTVVESNTSNNIRIHVWRNTSYRLNNFSHKAGTLHTFLSEAKTAGPAAGGILSTAKNYSFYDFTWSQSGSTRAEPSYHMKITMGDNGVIGFSRFNHDGYAQYYGTFTIASTGSAGNSGTGTFNDRGVNLANTTSYGIDQSESWYGMKHMMTWDNQWMATYSPYYYYGSGINCHVINTADPTKIFYFRNTTSVNGCAIVPFKEDKFMSCITPNNADGPGPYLYIVDPGSAATNFRRTDGTTLSYDGDLQPYNITTYYQFDTNASSTTYPHIISMPHWSNP
jgi:hypothetical protein